MLFTIQIIFRLPSTFMNHIFSVFMSPFALAIFGLSDGLYTTASVRPAIKACPAHPIKP